MMDRQSAQAIAIEQAKPMGWLTVALCVACATVYAVAICILLTTATWSWIAFAAMTFVAYAIYTPLHDAVHGAVSGGHRQWRWLNECVGMISGHILGIPFYSHRREHLEHHRHTNHSERDPDIAYSAHSPRQWLKMLFRALPLQYEFIARFDDFSDSDRRAIRWEIALIVLSRAVLLLVVADPLITVATIVTAHFLGNAILVSLFAWVVHHPHTETARFQQTTIYRLEGVFDPIITALWLHQNYHAIHHLYPKVPFFRYRRTYLAMQDYLKAQGVPHFNWWARPRANDA